MNDTNETMRMSDCIPHQNHISPNEEAAEDEAAGSTKMVNWREAKALRHIFDDLQDHFGHQRADPNVRFNAGLQYSGHGETWLADLDFTYNIDGDHCNLGYIGMDVCIDLSPKLVYKHGRRALKSYGKTWVYAYMPEMSWDKIKEYVKAGTGWDVSGTGIVHDPNRNIVAIEAKLNHQDGQPPTTTTSFWVVRDDKSAEKGESFSRLGSVQEINNDTSQQLIHRGVGIFSVSMEVEGTPNFKPTPRMGEEANLVFTLVSVRTWGVTDCIAPIVHAPRKW